MSDTEKQTPQSEKAFPRFNMSRRKFLNIMAGAVGSALLTGIPLETQAATSESKAKSQDINTSAISEKARNYETMLDELGTDTFFNPLSKNSLLFNQENNPNAEVRAAVMEKTLDEPVTEVLSKTTGVETDAQGNEIAFTEYTLEYNGQVFKARAKTLDSENFPSSLHRQFNEGEAEQYINKKITAVTFNSDAESNDELNKITIYCLQNYNADDPHSSTFALSPDFYEQGANSDDLQRQTLKEEWTVRHFATPLNPFSIKCISESASIKSFNKLRINDGGRLIRNSTVILSSKASDDAIAHPFTAKDDLETDNGSLYGSHFTPAEEQMKKMPATLSHELAHTTAVVYYNAIPFDFLYAALARNRVYESQAVTSEAGYWYLAGEPDQASTEYMGPLKDTFVLNPYTQSYDFLGYNPLLFMLPITQYDGQVAEALNSTPATRDEEGALTIEGLTRLGMQYVDLRNELFDVIESDWYFNWRRDTYPLGQEPPTETLVTQIDMYAPLVYAWYKNEGIDITTDKESFMQSVIDEVESHAFEINTQLIQDAFTDENSLSLPFVSETFYLAWKNLLDHKIVGSPVAAPVPELNQTVAVTRKIDNEYLKESIITSDEYFYHKIYPYYFMSHTEKPTPDHEFVIEKSTEEEDSLLVVIQPIYKAGTTDIIDSTRTIISAGEKVVIHPDMPSVICVLDKRKNQVEEDWARIETTLYTLSAQTRTTPLPQSNLYMPLAHT